MPLRAATIAMLAFLVACDGMAAGSAEAAARGLSPDAWTIGPVIGGRNYSQGMPLHPSPRRDGGLQIDLPRAPGSVHYVTFRHGPLTGKSRIVMRYRIEAGPQVRIVPRTDPAAPSIITLYFQRGGDTWSGRGRFEAYRWYATFASQSPITPGDHVMVAPLSGGWTAVEQSSARNNRAAFRAAIAAADQVGFVLGGGDGYGHGVYATGRARLIVTDYRIE